MTKVIDLISDKSIKPLSEAAAYEILWSEKGTSFKTISDFFKSKPSVRMSNMFKSDLLSQYKKLLVGHLNSVSYHINILNKGTFDFPEKLNDAKDRLEILYYSGDIGLLNTPSISVVGTRNPSDEGKKRAIKLVKLLVENKFTIMSGLARGIDTIAHTAAIENKGKTIAVIGTPINTFYPKENEELQRKIAKEHLLISQIPFVRYYKQTPNGNRLFFPERNKTMSALSLGTVIVEASDTSGTLIQARAALEQGRKLFILNNCFENKNITWPHKFEKLGAIRVKNIEDIINSIYA